MAKKTRKKFDIIDTNDGYVTLYDEYDKSAGYIIEKGNEYWTGKNWSDIKAYAESYKTKKEAEQKLKSTMADGGEVLYMVSRRGNPEYPEYIIERTDGSEMIQMFFDTEEDAIKYAKAKGYNLSKKNIMAKKTRKRYDTGGNVQPKLVKFDSMYDGLVDAYESVNEKDTYFYVSGEQGQYVVTQESKGFPASEAYDDWLYSYEDALNIAKKLASGEDFYEYFTDGGMMAKGGMTRKGGQPFEVNGRKFFYFKDDGNVYDTSHRLYAGSYDSLELAKKSLDKNFESIKKGNFYADGGMMADGGENFDFIKSSIESASGDKISHIEYDDYDEKIYWSTKNPYVNYYIGGEQIIKYDGKTGERYPIGELKHYMADGGMMADGGNTNDKFFTYLISWDDNNSLKVYKKEKSDFTNFSKQVERFEEMSKKLPYLEHWILNLREGQDPIENIKNAPTVKFDDDGGMMAKGGRVKKYELGDMWSPNFNYNGMLKMGINARITWGLEKLQALSDSFEDVNYHTENIKLIEAIDLLKKGDEAKARQALGTFNLRCRTALARTDIDSMTLTQMQHDEAQLRREQGFAKGGKVELIFHGSSREIPMGEFESSAAAKRYVEASDWQRPYSIKKLSKRNKFEEEVFEYAKGGKVKLIFLGSGSSKEIPVGEFESAAAAKRYVESLDGKRPYKIRKVVNPIGVSSFSKEYKLVPYIPYGVKGMITPDYKSSQRFMGTQDEAVAKAKELVNSNPNFVNVEIKRELKTKTYTVGIINGQNKNYAKGGGISDAAYKRRMKMFGHKPYGETKGKFKVTYNAYGEPQTEIWDSMEMAKDSAKRYSRIDEFSDVKIFDESGKEIQFMARGGEPKPSLIPDYSKISGVVVEGIDTNDAPDFVDAYIADAYYDGEPMTDEQLEELNYDGDFVYSAVERHLYADGGKVRLKKKDKLWESIKNKFSEIFYLRETNPNEIFSNDVTAEKNEYLYFAAAWVTTTLSFEEAENKFMKMLTDDEKKMIKIERNVKDINEAFGLMSEKKILVKRIDKMDDGGMTEGKKKRTVKLTLSDKDSYDYTYKQDGTTASITFGFGKEPFEYEVKKISKSLEPLQQDILDTFTLQGIKQHDYKGGYSEAIKHLDTAILQNAGKITKNDIISGAKFKTSNGTIFIIDKVNEIKDGYQAVESSIEGGQKGNYRDDINDLVIFLNEEQSEKMAKGGITNGIQFDRNRNGSLYDRGRADSYYGRAREPHWYPDGTYQGEMITELTNKEIEEYNKGYDENTDYKDYGEMAKGGKVKSRWIQEALSGNKGELRKTAKRKGLIKGDEKLSKTDLNKLQKMGGKTAKRARLAETLIEFKK
jgi:hypothetical protein